MEIEHVAMYVGDLEGARAFFTHYFAAVAGERYVNPTTGFSSYFLTFPQGARLELMTRPGLAETTETALRLGLSHVAFRVGTREAVDRLTDQLRRDGYTVVSGPRTTGDGYYESCISGPEGNLVEITG